MRLRYVILGIIAIVVVLVLIAAVATTGGGLDAHPAGSGQAQPSLAT